MATFEEGCNGSAVTAFSPSLGGGDAVTVNGGGGGQASREPFDIEDGKIVRCGLYFGRKWLQCQDTALQALDGESAPEGVIYATVSHGGGGQPTLSVHWGRSLPDNGVDASHRGLYAAFGYADQWTDIRRAATIVALD